MTSDPPLLVLFAHGSPDPRWQQTFQSITTDVADVAGAERVRLAYMEFVGPTLLEVAREASEKGIRSILLLPMFMSGGGHVGRDIPAQAAQAMEQFPEVTIEVLPPLGEMDPVRQAIVDAAIAVAR